MFVRALTLSCVLAIGTARADTMTASLGEPLREVSHTVDVSFHDGLATFEVERAFTNAGTRADEVVLTIDLPPGAVATGLRIQGDGVWYEGELLLREEAAARYQELTGFGQAELKDPALLSWVSDGVLSLQLFPIRPNQIHRVAYTLVAPADYVAGVEQAYYPERSEPTMATPKLRVDGSAKVTRGTDGPEREGGCVGSDLSFASVSQPPSFIPIVAPRYGRFALAGARALWRFELDAAPHIGEVPRGAHVVLVLDESRSQGPDGVEAQAALARAYLAHFPAETQVEVIWYARKPRREHGRFVSLAVARARLAAVSQHPMATKNGSMLEDALAETGKILSNVSGARRVVLMTDGLLRSRFTNELAIAALRGARPDRVDADLVLHIIRRGSDDISSAEAPSEERDDQDALAPIAAAFGGMLGRVAHMGDAKALAAVALPYARPVRIDAFEVEAGGLPLTSEGTLAEGTTLRGAGIAAAPADLVYLRGMIWGRPWQLIVKPSAAYTTRAAVLAFGDGSYSGLLPDEQRAAAMLGAVSPVTSYLAIEPGVRPSQEGITTRLGRGCAGLGFLGEGAGGANTGAFWGSDPNRAALDAAAQDAAASCRRAQPATPVSLAIETVADEVLDIQPAAGSAFARCVVERLWDVRLPGYAGTNSYDIELE